MLRQARTLPSSAAPGGRVTKAYPYPRGLHGHSGNVQGFGRTPATEAVQRISTALTRAKDAGDTNASPSPDSTPSMSPNLRPVQIPLDFQHEYLNAVYDGPDLYHRFRASGQYMKYRSRQRFHEANSREHTWHDAVEAAFFRALVRWPPMGRRKVNHNGKQRGRNELIADYIEQVTKEKRSRKQVSSHIQVLKPFVKGDPFIMRYLSKDDLRMDEVSISGRHRLLSPSDGEISSRNGPFLVSAIASQFSNASVMRIDSNYLASLRSISAVFQPMEFQMFVQCRPYGQKSERLHTYTSNIGMQSVEHVQLYDWQSFDDGFPLLAAMHYQQPLHGAVISVEASIALPPVEIWLDKGGACLPDVELGILFLWGSAHLPPSSLVACRTVFYRNGQPICDDLTRPFETQLAPAGNSDHVETQLKFGSTFWAKTLAALAARFRTPSDAEDYARDEVSEYLRSMVVVQDIAVMTDRGYERLTVTHWRFKLSDNPDGLTTWRYLNLPPPSLDFPAPRPAVNRPPLRGDSVHNEPESPDSGIVQGTSPFEYGSSTSNSTSTSSSAAWPNEEFASEPGAVSTMPLRHGDDNPPLEMIADEKFKPQHAYDPDLGFTRHDTVASPMGIHDLATPVSGVWKQEHDQHQYPHQHQHQIYAQTALHLIQSQGAAGWHVGYANNAGRNEYGDNERGFYGGTDEQRVGGRGYVLPYGMAVYGGLGYGEGGLFPLAMTEAGFRE